MANSMGVQNKIGSVVEGRNSKIPHSENCTWDSQKYRLSNNNVCLACDTMRTYRAGLERIPDSAFGLDVKIRKEIYCVSAQIPYARCTEHTNPSCACGRRVYYKTKLKGMGELF
jgi:hypothetical protein